MMEILVLSDSHGDYDSAKEIVSKYPQASVVLFLGDGDDEFLKLATVYRQKTFYGVSGNNDYFLPDTELCLTLQEKKVYMTHGHRGISVKQSLEGVLSKGIACQADIVLFGHTHQAMQMFHHKMLVMNPGAVYNNGSGSSYGRIVIQKGTILHELLTHR